LFAFLFASSLHAAPGNFKVIDDDVYKKVMAKTETSKADLKIYRKIFEAFSKNDLKKADKLIPELKSDALTGHVLARKYLHKDYKSTYKELTDWLKKYPELPEYSQINTLAITKAPGYKPPKAAPPQPKRLYASYSWYNNKYENLSEANRKYVKEQVDLFLRAIRAGKNDDAEKILEIKKFRMTIPDREYDAMSATLAGAYLFKEDNEKALKWTKKAITRSSDATATWFGGLAAYREKDYKTAASYFGKLARMTNTDEWLVSAGGYWAYRANTKLKNKTEAKKYLEMSAKSKRTFYGILARHKINEEISYDWAHSVHFNDFSNREYVKEILKSPAMSRAVLLLKVGETDLAESELRRHFRGLSKKQREILLHMSSQFNMPNLGYIVSDSLKDYPNNREYHSFIYPYPDWEPTGGWKVNPSWVWALVRQESLFSPTVRSHAGATGLMQLMPATAAAMTKDNSLKKNWRPLFDKSNNLTIGQTYVVFLRGTDFVGDNLFYLAAAYNAGEHNMKKWQKEEYDEDPLMFAEMIPWRETRLYVKRVLANYWIYNTRMGQKSQSLEQLAKGEWPMIDEID